MDLRELYQEVILDHGKNPRNHRFPEPFNREGRGYNPLCGDKITLRLQLDALSLLETERGLLDPVPLLPPAVGQIRRIDQVLPVVQLPQKHVYRNYTDYTKKERNENALRPFQYQAFKVSFFHRKVDTHS